ncbi:putative Undecaprenyl-phosphate galactose phosphotransferase [Georgfuchsia toluolica]|uniref:Undecaprenyl-phosphate galactose phosphotransferase n=1 Tax=Georgfuchsia toluolica TaxID=424218 RepID=A0A916J526_9PROT|nr:undecaprenyl-phosphate galactose phosphotransferase WbaP [Georgfuchsia toluolica]CAG4884369.1 putative Undecaprenyl-phosphate galactose phosphotransferase [Georgfuchsia toluolica]
MSKEISTAALGSNHIASAQQHTTQPKMFPRRSLIVLVVLVLIAIGLIVLPQPTLYYPHVVMEAGGGMRLDFLLNGRQDKAACENTAASVVNAITTSCHLCRTDIQACIENPTAELRQRFDETPLSVASARIANGVILYTAPHADAALLACRESEHQATLRGDRAKVACYPAGAARPHTAFEVRQKEAADNTFTSLMDLVGSLIAALTLAIVATYIRHRRYLANPAIGPAGILILPTYPWLQKFTLASVDVLILLGTFIAISWPASDDFYSWSRLDRDAVISQAVVIVITIGWFWLLLEHYARRRPFWDELRAIIRVLAMMFMVSSAVAFVADLETGRTSHLIAWGLNFILIPLGRYGARHLLDDLGLWQLPAVIVGTGENARAALLAINSEREMGYRILGFIRVDTNSSSQGSPLRSLPGDATDGAIHTSLTIGQETFPILDQSQPLDLVLQNLDNPRVIVAFDSLIDPENQTIIQSLLSTHANIHIIPALRGLPLFGTQVSHFFSHEVLFLTVRNNLSRRGYVWIKRSFDLVVASLLLILLSPFLLALAILIRREGGTAIYGHTRIGRGGKPFKCLKFRSMRPDADKILKQLLENDPAAKAEWEKDFKLRNDPRITPVGHFLRKTSLDELPQLINVVRGEMSLVGPRPIVTAELERYEDSVDLYLQVRPGVTGLWQISGRNETSYAQRVSLDAWYVRNWSLWYDIAILFKTINVVFNRHGAY